MKKILQIILVSLLVLITLLSLVSSVIIKNKLEKIKIQDENIVFFGDSITEGYNVKEFFDEYFQDRKIAYAYKLGKVKRYETPKTLLDYGIKAAPQSFVYI